MCGIKIFLIISIANVCGAWNGERVDNKSLSVLDSTEGRVFLVSSRALWVCVSLI